MGKALSVDLRVRVIDAIGAGMSRRAAATRFGISSATAVRWAQRQRDAGSVAPARQGGDMRSRATEVHALRIMAAYEATPDGTLAELRVALAELRVALAEDGISLAVATLWRFFRRRAITRKKRPATRPSRIAQTSSSAVARGSARRPTSIPGGSPSSTRPGCAPRWPGSMDAARGASGCAWQSRTATGTPRPSSARFGSRA
jgi:transposase